MSNLIAKTSLTGVQDCNAHAVKEGILARQKRIQELFAGGGSSSKGDLPQVGKFKKQEMQRKFPSRNIMMDDAELDPKKLRWPSKTKTTTSSSLLDHQSHSDDPTEECTDHGLDDSASWGSQLKPVEEIVVVPGSASEPPQVQEQHRQQKQETVPQPWGKYKFAGEEDDGDDQAKEEAQATTPAVVTTPAIPGHKQQPEPIKKPELINKQEPQPLSDLQAIAKRVMRKKVHKELVQTHDECVKIQQEYEAKRDEKYGQSVKSWTELTDLELKAVQKQERLKQAKQRIAVQHATRDEKLRARQRKQIQVDRRQHAYETYLHLGMPHKQKFKARIAQSGRHLRLQPDDVDLLPWFPGDFSVNVAALTKMNEDYLKSKEEEDDDGDLLCSLSDMEE